MQYIFEQTQVRVFSHSPDKLGHLYKLLMDKFHYWKLKQALQDKLNRFSGDHGNQVNIIKCVKTQAKQRSPLNIHSHDTQYNEVWQMRWYLLTYSVSYLFLNLPPQNLHIPWLLAINYLSHSTKLIVMLRTYPLIGRELLNHDMDVGNIWPMSSSLNGIFSHWEVWFWVQNLPCACLAFLKKKLICGKYDRKM